jgi:hypothetical protein
VSSASLSRAVGDGARDHVRAVPDDERVAARIERTNIVPLSVQLRLVTPTMSIAATSMDRPRCRRSRPRCTSGAVIGLRGRDDRDGVDRVDDADDEAVRVGQAAGIGHRSR